MKKSFVFLYLIACGILVQAQINADIPPLSSNITAIAHRPVEQVTLPAFNRRAADSLDAIDAATGALPKFARSINTDISLSNSGAWSDVPGGRVWLLKVKANGAQALIPYYDEFYLPEGATLHVYSADRKQMLGAFTPNNNPANKLYCTGMVRGSSFIMEYFEPTISYGLGRLHINEIGYAYRMVNSSNAGRDFGDADNCEINVNCSEGANWQSQKRSVCRILVKEGNTQGWCTGAMVNNARQDCTPYFLSADHCAGAASVGDINQWVFYFAYESPNCANPNVEGSLDNKFTTGAVKKADSNDNGGDTGSDFLLLQLNNQPPTSYNVFYAGWNNVNTAPSTTGVCIHHPSGDIKKISTFTQAPSSTTWGGSVSGTHWRVRWAATANGHGVTEPGSSGSPIFNNAGHIVGHLTGGNSFCNTPTQQDFYGKVSFDWTSNGTPNTERLKPWLDPDNTGISSLDGIDAPCGTGALNDAGITAITSPVEAVCDVVLAPVVTLRNFGSNNLTAVTILYTVGQGNNVYQWNGNLAPNAQTSVTLPGINVGAGTYTLTVQTTDPNSSTDANANNDAKTTSVTMLGLNGAITFFLRTDEFGSETSWQIVNSANQAVAGAGPYTDNNAQLFTYNLCLPAGCYQLRVFDSFGDGLSGDQTGLYQLTNAGVSVVYANMPQANFGASEVHDFCLTGVGIADEDAAVFTLFPNPAKGIVNLQLADAYANSNVMVTDNTGRLITDINTDNQTNVLIDVSTFAKGMYYVTFNTGTGKYVKKLVVE